MYIIYLFLLEFLSSFLEDKNGAQKCNLESHDFHQVFLVRKLWGSMYVYSVNMKHLNHNYDMKIVKIKYHILSKHIDFTNILKMAISAW